MIVLSYWIKGERGEYCFNIDYNHTLKRYNITYAERIERADNKRIACPVPLALFNRVYESTDEAKMASQQWINKAEITAGRV